MIRALLILFLAVSPFGSGINGQDENEISKDGNSIRLAFGSCSKTNLDQHLWDDILASDPDAWIWLGDIIYGDSEDMSVLRQKYALQKAHPGYQALVQSTQILGVWDDHDYGLNNGGKEFGPKDESRDLLFDFLGLTAEDPARNRPGAYTRTVLSQSDLKVEVVLLDVRYFRDPIQRTNGHYLPNDTGSILGDEQWRWLENILSSTTSDCIILGSGIQILPDQHPFEKWSNFPNEKLRLLSAIQSCHVPVVMISGDRHIGEISVMRKVDDKRPMVEITSSGLTHAWKEAREANAYRKGPLVTVNHFGVIDLKKNETELVTDVRICSEGGHVACKNAFHFPYTR